MNSGQLVSKDWSDPLRDAGKGGHDVGAVPLGTEVWGVGVNGRTALFSGTLNAKWQPFTSRGWEAYRSRAAHYVEGAAMERAED